VFEHIYRLQQRNRKRKRNLRRLLKRFHKMTVALPDAIVELAPGSDEIGSSTPEARGPSALIRLRPRPRCR